ncbi:MAG: aspartate kinase [Phycisphaerales bacterium]|nr:aspartate kinase [Phycisphaerales bacterium]
MTMIVQKYGGTSIADVDKIKRAARRVCAARRADCDVVVVVSAVGKATDRLIEMAEEVCDAPPRRELDMLLATGEQVSIALMAMALQSDGCEAVSYTGGQIAIRTDTAFSSARIRSIDVQRIRRDCEAGRVVIVAGFQGVTEEGEITTLGRGGSDITAVALAAVLDADACELYTDVAGVFTCDPRIVPNARRLDRISYEEMFEMASTGSGIIHPRAVLFGMKYGVPIHIRHSQQEGEGTYVVQETPAMEDILISGVALKPEIGRVTLSIVPHKPGVVAAVFSAIAEADILVDDIIQNEITRDTATISFTVEHADLADVKPIVESLCAKVGGELTIDVGLAKVSAVGVGMKSHAGVAAKMFQALAEANINIANITTSEIKISVIIDKADGEAAALAIHNAFGLDRSGACRE